MASTSNKDYLLPFRHRDFSVFWTGSFLSSMGTQFTTVAMAWQIYELTNSPMQIGLLGLARALPQIVLLLVGGLLADAMDRRKLMMCTQTGLFCVSTTLALLSYFGQASSAMLYGATMLLAIFTSLGTTVAPIDDSQSGAAPSFGASIGAARDATLCADHRRSVDRRFGSRLFRAGRLLCRRCLLLAGDAVGPENAPHQDPRRRRLEKRLARLAAPRLELRLVARRDFPADAARLQRNLLRQRARIISDLRPRHFVRRSGRTRIALRRARRRLAACRHRHDLARPGQDGAAAGSSSVSVFTVCPRRCSRNPRSFGFP